MSSNKVYFCNAEVIDLNAIAVMGVSVKTIDSPIGYFGTGLKFALATLLRLGHRVTLYRGGREVVFRTEPEVIRGQNFDRIVMDDSCEVQRLGFTTQLGRNWEPWQAYRELACNVMDEGGVVTINPPTLDAFGTVFVVDGPALAECHRNRRDTFLETPIIHTCSDGSIHDEGGRNAYYRGVRAHTHQFTALFSYNITTALSLTEDRNVKSAWEVGYHVERMVASCDDEYVLERVLLAEKGTFEQQLSYTNVTSKPSLAFMDVVHRYRHDHKLNFGAVRLWEQHSDFRLTYAEAQLDPFDEEQIVAALVLTRRLGCEIGRDDFMVVEGLGEGCCGAVRHGHVLLSRLALDKGPRYVASTLYEEWLHKTQDMRDESRALQNLLFERLLAMTERVVALEGRRQ